MAPGGPRKRVKPNPDSEEPAPPEVPATQIPLPTETSPTEESPRRPPQTPANSTGDHSNRGVCLAAAHGEFRLIAINRVGTGHGLGRLHQ